MGCGNSKLRSYKTKKRVSDRVAINSGQLIKKNRGKLPSFYKEIKILGSGAFAEVRLYKHLPTNSFRAIKAIHKVGLHQQQLDECYLLKEISVLISLDHPNILRCYEIFEDSWRYYVSMEYCDGGQLFTKILEMNTFTEKEAACIMYQILSAIYYCHSKNIIHRDLKPENILLEKNSQTLSLKIADFGSSCILGCNQRLSGCFGSAYYVAPEVLTDEYNEKCDIWSCGVILFILMTGKPPYPGRDGKVIINLIKTNPLQISSDIVPGVSPDCIDLLKQLLDIDPKLRISANDAVNHPWILQHKNQDKGNDLTGILKSLSEFNASVKLKDAVHVFLATQVISNEESSQLSRYFHSIDKNSDGKISKSELLSKYNEIMDERSAKETVDKIMSQLDINQSGDIDYTEFLSACMNFKKYLSKEYLFAAFQLFDRDGSGFITADEIMEVLGSGSNLPDKAWEEIIRDADENGDGVIDLKEFIGLMTN